MTTQRLLPLAATLIICSSGLQADTAPSEVNFDSNLQVTTPLTKQPGDATAGRAVFSDRKLGNCLACHALTDQSEHQFHGEVGPALDGVAKRYPAGLLRTIVINAKKVFGPQKFQGKTILNAQQTEDLLAYLQTLK